MFWFYTVYLSKQKFVSVNGIFVKKKKKATKIGGKLNKSGGESKNSH